MNLPQRFHEADLTAHPGGSSRSVMHQNLDFSEDTSVSYSALTSDPFPKMPFMLAMQQTTNQNDNNVYQQTTRFEMHPFHETRLVSYSRSPSLVPDSNYMEFTSVAPTSMPMDVQIGPQSRAETCASTVPHFDFAGLSPVDQCARMPYATPHIHGRRNTSSPFSQTMSQQHFQNQHQLQSKLRQQTPHLCREEPVLTPPVSRRSSTDTPQPSSDEEMITEQISMITKTQTQRQYSSQSRDNQSTQSTLTIKPKPHTKAKAKAKAKASKSLINNATTTTTSATTGVDVTKSEPQNDDKDTKLSASRLRARQAHTLVERRYRENLNLRIAQLHESLQNTKFGPSPPSPLPPPSLQDQQIDHRHPQRQQYHQQHQHHYIANPSTSTSTNTRTMLPSQPEHQQPSTGSSNIIISSGTSTTTTTIATTTTTMATTITNQDKTRKSDILVSAMAYIDHAEAEMHRMSNEIARLSARVYTLENAW